MAYAEQDNPFVAATVAPDHPRVRIGLAVTYFELRGGAVPVAEERAALDALKRAPLADEPFLLAGVAALAANDVARGERLLTEARRRNPRLRMARLLLLDRYMRERRIAEAAEEMAALSRLIPGAGTLLTQAVARMVRDPATSTQAIAILRTRPELENAVLEDLAGSDADPNLILGIAGPSLSRAGRATPPWEQPLLERLVARGDLAQALRLWGIFTGLTGQHGDKLLYDRDFRGLPGPPPFNWKFSTGGAGVAERAKGALQVAYYGRDDAELASQLLVLPPGRYRLTVHAQGDASGEGSRLAWTVGCDSGGEPLVQLPLTGVASAPRRFGAAFTVPAAGCRAQWLRLKGVSGDVATAQNATISGLSIDRESAP